ncbi:MAG TPA: hypothetical protein VMH39_00390, partial [Gemmatimonadaceae bacterium]|nr:hypothetical protein [Gemmatimonadaceae bacterium]
MDRRTLLALVLSAIVIIITPRIFRPNVAPVDSTALGATADSAAQPAPPVAIPAAHTPTPPPAPELASQPDTVRTGSAAVVFSSPGASVATIKLLGYADLSPRHAGPVTLAEPSAPLLRFRLVEGNDTLPLSRVAMTARRDSTGVTYEANSPSMTIEYRVGTGG